MKVFKVGVGEMVSFLFASGDLSSETFQNVSLLEGTRAHQYVQSMYTSDDQAEVFIDIEVQIADDLIILSGRMDGLLYKDQSQIIEEIKSTRKSIFDPEFKVSPEHVAQLKMYAYMYMVKHHLTDIKGRLSYIELSSYKMKHIEEVYDIDLLKVFFEEAIYKYHEWLLILDAHNTSKKESLDQLVFPFEYYRKGQRDMMIGVYQAMMNKEILYAIAPTGIGKTMAALFSTLKAMTDPMHKIFYLTAKTQGKQVAIDTMDMLHEAGLSMKTLELTSKDQICFLDKRECDPNKCPFAKGFFDRLVDATKDIFTHETLMKRDTIESYAKKHMVCPFEFSLYVSYYVDVIICDYNYAFDPRAHLIRYFEESEYKPLILIDEAHNMISRSREMYSATLYQSDIIKLRRNASKLKPSIRTGVKKLLDVFEGYQEQLQTTDIITMNDLDDACIEAVQYLMKKIENALKETPQYHKKFDVMEGYLSLLSFLRIYDYYNQTYVTNIMFHQDQDISISIQCLDASAFILDTIKQHTHGTVFFSATLYPIDYYQILLTQGEGKFLKIDSPFDPKKLKLIIMNNISTRYQDRDQSLDDVIESLLAVITSKKGNYIAFFPSYFYMQQVIKRLPSDLEADLIIQKQDMDQQLRNVLIERFKTNNEKTQLAFFVMGGVFSEGIDYVGDMLNGVVIVGVGLPMVNTLNNQLKTYYDDAFQKGFEYAYTYPGMNKVIQAVGRVIRRHSDYGVAVLIDDRFHSTRYKKLFPIYWEKPEVINDKVKLQKALKLFWDQWS